jgi:hypothetical protein
MSQEVIGHELLHAYHLSLINQGYSLKTYGKYTEKAASSYSYLYYKTRGVFSYDAFHNIGDYPKIYSWRIFKVLNIYELGL